MLWLVVLGLWARGTLSSVASVVYLLAVAAVAVFLARAVQLMTRGDDGWGTGRKALLLFLLVAVPTVFDQKTWEVFNVAKYAVLVVSAFALVGLWVIGAVSHRSPPTWRNGLHWPVLAVVAWTALSTATSVNPRFSALGAYESYDGLYATLAFAAVLFVIADTFKLADLKTVLVALYLGGGGLVVLYGLIQLHDVALGGRNWDWVPWLGGAGLTAISANLGNPNYVGGFLAMMFPVGLVLLVLARSRRMRALIAVMGAVIVVELVHTASRGAWLAVLAASVTLAVLLAGEVRRRPGIFVTVALAYVTVAVVSALTLGSSGSLQKKLDPDELSATEATSANQRVELWKAAMRMANDRPLVGVGPDAYGPRFFAYQSAAFTERYGTRLFANGAHNVFFNQMATQGYPGLAALLALIGSAAALGVTAWRLLRRQEREGGGRRMRPEHDAELRRRAAEGRLAVAAIGSGLLAYLVQASFNVQRISLSFVFWTLLGLLCVAARGAGANIQSLRWWRGEETTDGGSTADLPRPDGSSARRGGFRRPRPVALSNADQFFVYGVAFVVIVGLIGIGALAAAPWRADRAYSQARALVGSQVGAQSSPETAARAFDSLRAARALNPWESRYHSSEALEAVRQAAHAPAGSQRQRDLLARARSAYRQIIRVEPGGPRFLLVYGDALLQLYQAQPSVGEAREEALVALRRAHRLSPRDPDITARLGAAERP